MLKCKILGANGVDHAIRGMRNPMNSWNKSDSVWTDIDSEYLMEEEMEYPEIRFCDGVSNFVVGDNDADLMKRLFKCGTEHRKYLRMIQVYMDIEAPLYWWKEFDTYKIGTVCNSCSTMHKIHSKEFTLDDFSTEHLCEESIGVLHEVIYALNSARMAYNDYDEYKDVLTDEITSKKDLWWQMIQLLPSSYNQKRTVMLNYEVVVNIINQRKNHKLDEWHQLVDTLKGLPMIEYLMG